MIALVSANQALAKVGESIGLSAKTYAGLNDDLLAQTLRRAVFFMAPCQAHELCRAVASSLSCSKLPIEQVKERVESIVESLIVFGDILEMRLEDNNAWSFVSGFALRPAPPTFVVRKNGSIVLLGVAGDQISPLTHELDVRVKFENSIRVLNPHEDEDLPGLLLELGLLRLPEHSWLRLPKQETAASHIAFWNQDVRKQPQSTVLENIRIIDPASSPTFYRDRWTEPKRRHTGIFVARRGQKYGSDLWCLVELDAGVSTRFKDFATPGDRLRPFDLACRYQAAVDAVQKPPQQFTCVTESEISVVRFYSPLPSWAERRLSTVGTKTTADKCLFSYEIHNDRVAAEIEFLDEWLWMKDKSKLQTGDGV